MIWSSAARPRRTRVTVFYGSSAEPPSPSSPALGGAGDVVRCRRRPRRSSPRPARSSSSRSSDASPSAPPRRLAAAAAAAAAATAGATLAARRRPRRRRSRHRAVGRTGRPAVLRRLGVGGLLLAAFLAGVFLAVGLLRGRRGSAASASVSRRGRVRGRGRLLGRRPSWRPSSALLDRVGGPGRHCRQRSCAAASSRRRVAGGLLGGRPSWPPSSSRRSCWPSSWPPSSWRWPSWQPPSWRASRPVGGVGSDVGFRSGGGLVVGHVVLLDPAPRVTRTGRSDAAAPVSRRAAKPSGGGDTLRRCVTEAGPSPTAVAGLSAGRCHRPAWPRRGLATTSVHCAAHPGSGTARTSSGRLRMCVVDHVEYRTADAHSRRRRLRSPGCSGSPIAPVSGVERTLFQPGEQRYAVELEPRHRGQSGEHVVGPHRGLGVAQHQLQHRQPGRLGDLQRQHRRPAVEAPQPLLGHPLDRHLRRRPGTPRPPARPRPTAAASSSRQRLASSRSLSEPPGDIDHLQHVEPVRHRLVERRVDVAGLDDLAPARARGTPPRWPRRSAPRRRTRSAGAG